MFFFKKHVSFVLKQENKTCFFEKKGIFQHCYCLFLSSCS